MSSFSVIGRLRQFATVAMTLLFITTGLGVPLASGLTTGDLHSIRNYTSLYDPADTGTCTASSAGPGGSIPGFLDPAKVPEPLRSYFIKAGQKYNVAPGAVAGLYLTEQNGFPWYKKYFESGKTDLSVFGKLTTTSPEWKTSKFQIGSFKNGPWSVGNVNGSNGRQFRGPFQFGGSEWTHMGEDGDGDGLKSADDFYDEVFAASHYMAILGGTTDKGSAGVVQAAHRYNGQQTVGFDGRLIEFIYGDQVALLATAISTTTNGGAAAPAPAPAAPAAPSTGTCSAGPGAVSGSIVQTAVNLAWPEPWSTAAAQKEPGRTGPLVPKPSYLIALKQFNPGGMQNNQGADCGVFVSTVMRASGADPNYPAIGTTVQAAYVKSHPEKYTIIPRVNSTAELLPGDILIVNGAPGHTFLFIGAQPGGFNEASASLNDREPNLGQAITHDDRGDYMVVRLK